MVAHQRSPLRAASMWLRKRVRRDLFGFGSFKVATARHSRLHLLMSRIRERLHLKCSGS
jgi:hypothetical protein